MIAALIVAFIFIYSIIPGLPLSGMLLDMEETTYLGQLFGSNSYFQDGFTLYGFDLLYGNGFGLWIFF